MEAIYLSLMITSEVVFPDTMMDTGEQPIIYLKGTADYSFMPDGGRRQVMRMAVRVR